MKKIYTSLFLISIVILFVVFSGCDFRPEPEFYIDGKPYYTRIYCVESHSEEKWGYHYGMSFKGKMEYHFGLYSDDICDKYKTDTIEIK